jgi:transcriptional regulator with XRE-family HTH domain
MTNISTNFRRLRIEEGYTQESMAEELGVSTSVVNRIESGKRQIKMEEIKKIAKATHKTQEQVLSDLYGITINSSIKDNHGNGVNVENTDVKTIKELYERIIAEKEKYICVLETQLREAQAR